jgi:hypothetical protein
MKAFLLFLMTTVLIASGTVRGHASLRPYEKLTLDEQIALQESERRLILYDQKLQALDRELHRHKISIQDYKWMNGDLTVLIAQESAYQNSLLIKKSDLKERAADLLRTIGTVAIAVPTYTLIAIVYVVGHSSGLHGSFSP